MKVEIVKSGNLNWYSKLSLPKIVEVEKIGDKYRIISGEYENNYLSCDHCVLIEEDKELFCKSREFKSGAKRDSNINKIRPDLISPYMLKSLGLVMAEGARHYGERNWEKGIPDEVLKESASRHYVSWMNNEDDEDHASKLIFNVMAWIHNRDKK